MCDDDAGGRNLQHLSKSQFNYEVAQEVMLRTNSEQKLHIQCVCVCVCALPHLNSNVISTLSFFSRT